MTSSLVSVVMPLYNKETEIGRAINSVINQEFRDFELIVVDDGSTDSGPQIANGFRDPRVRVVSQANAGVSAARNRGIELARSGLIAFLDADDEWRPEFLSTILRLNEEFRDCAVYATSYNVCRRGGLCRPATIRGLPREFREGVLENYFQVAASSAPPLCSSAVAVTKYAIQGIGGFPVGVGSGEDLLTWARLALKYKIAYSTESLAVFWEPKDAASRPGRMPAMPDRVGEELQQLVEEHALNVPAGMVDYLALWHRMRGVIFLQLANSQGARAEFIRAMRVSGPSVKLVALFLMSMVPGRGAQFLYRNIRNVSMRKASNV